MSETNFDNPDIAALQKQLDDAKAAMATEPEIAQVVEAVVPATEAPAAEPAPVEVEAVVVPAAEVPADQQQALINAEASMFLANIPAAGNTMGALVAATQSDDHGSASHLFPILTQQSGNTGGAFARAKHMSAMEAANLPEGMNPFTAVFIGYRFIASAWADSGNSANGEKKRPVFSCALGANEAELTNQLMTIGKEYQFTAQKDKDKYDTADGGPGHIRPQIEMLLFDPEFGDLFTYQTCSHYNSAKDTRDELLKNATTLADQTQSMLPFIGVFTPITTRNTTKGGREIAHHHSKIDKLDIRDANAQKAWAAWQQFSNDARADAAIMDKVNSWFAGDDASITSNCRQSLKDGVGI